LGENDAGHVEERDVRMSLAMTLICRELKVFESGFCVGWVGGVAAVDVDHGEVEEAWGDLDDSHDL
jgi:hypothetical protein